MEGGMWVLATWLACNGAPTSDLGTVEKTDDGNHQVSYTDVGVACVHTRDGLVEVLVDFGDCLFCADEVELSCEAAVEDGTLVVHAGGSLVLLKDCEGDGTCQPITTTCTAPDVAEGAYILSYAGIDIPFAVPDEEWACTGQAGGV